MERKEAVVPSFPKDSIHSPADEREATQFRHGPAERAASARTANLDYPQYYDWLQARRNFREAARRLLLVRHNPSLSPCQRSQLTCVLHRKHLEAGLLFQLAALRLNEEVPDASALLSLGLPELHDATTCEDIEMLGCAAAMNAELLKLNSDIVDMMRTCLQDEQTILVERYRALGGMEGTPALIEACGHGCLPTETRAEQ